MGLSYLVYPGAHHTRFHHALGCMHLMVKAVEVLRFKGVEITSEEETGLLLFMEELNRRFNGSLTVALEIFNGKYSKKFLNQLVSSQLDMDRLDYLKRDSFYTGVAEGGINAERLITMLAVVNDELVVEEKGVYSVEKFLMARRFTIID